MWVKSCFRLRELDSLPALLPALVCISHREPGQSVPRRLEAPGSAAGELLEESKWQAPCEEIWEGKQQWRVSVREQRRNISPFSAGSHQAILLLPLNPPNGVRQKSKKCTN